MNRRAALHALRGHGVGACGLWCSIVRHFLQVLTRLLQHRLVAAPYQAHVYFVTMQDELKLIHSSLRLTRSGRCSLASNDTHSHTLSPSRSLALVRAFYRCRLSPALSLPLLLGRLRRGKTSSALIGPHDIGAGERERASRRRREGGRESARAREEKRFIAISK